jgi:hypothetical protein
MAGGCLICDRLALWREGRNPWRHSAEFKNHLVTPDQAQEIAARVRRHL